jgi:Zn-finger protein
MDNTIEIAQKINKEDSSKFLFSICTLVTRKQEYEEMLDSFLKKGFSTDDCEYLYIDNSENSTYDAYEGLNIFLQKAKGKYVILCHQDIIIHDNDKNNLVNLIEEVESKDHNWGILANAGGINLKWIATHITQGNGRIIKEKDLPLKVKTVDENFIIVKKSANIALSKDLFGFHFYGTDICIIADVLGFNCYVIGFNIIHKSNGKPDASFDKLRKELKLKYRKAFRNRFFTTTFSRFCLSGTYFIYYFNNSKPVLFLVRQYYKFFTKKKDYKI